MNRGTFLNRSLAWVGTGALAARAPLAASAAFTTVVYVGTYTPNADGIYICRLDSGSGALARIGVVRGIKNPSWLALHPDKGHLYAVSEVDGANGVQGGTLSAFAIDPGSGDLTAINTVPTHGAAPTFVSVHPSGRYALVANYGGGSVAVVPIRPDGGLSEPSDVVAGYGPLHPANAADDPPGTFGTSNHSGSHVHMVAADPSGRFVIANDAGLDRTYIWRLDLASGKLVAADAPVVDAPAGSAPRHFAFRPNGRVLYNLSEHDAMLDVSDFDPVSGRLTKKQRLSILPAGFAGSNLASEVIVSADGRFVYAANRLHDTIAIFAAAADGRLTLVTEQWVYADYPRSIALDPTGRFMFSCNQKSDSITTFERDARTGELRFTGRYTPLGTPVNMTFLA